MSDLRNTILRPDMKERGRDDRRNLRALAQENHDLKKQGRKDRKRIKELEALADPLTRALYNEMRISHKTIVLEKKELEEKCTRHQSAEDAMNEVLGEWE